MVEFLTELLLVARWRLKSRARLEAENIVLRQQVIVLSRKARSRVWLRNIDRRIFVWMYRLFPSVLNAITVVKPETVIRWHRRGFRALLALEIPPACWTPQNQSRDPRSHPTDEQGEPTVGRAADTQRTADARDRSRRINRGEYMTRRPGPPSQGWKTFLRNHAAGIASIDPFVVLHYLRQAALRPANSSPRPKATGEHQGRAHVRTSRLQNVDASGSL